MSTWPVPSALNPDQAFPKLTESQIARLLPFGIVRTVTKGEILFEPGDFNVPFFVVLAGELEIVQPIQDTERAITEHHAGQFTGEINMISGQRSFVRGRVGEDGEFLEITADGLRSIVHSDAEFSEIFMRAFILRRVALVSSGYGNIILLGSRHSADTLRLREFLSRNGQPHTYMDLDADKAAQEMLDKFQVKMSEIPVVVCGSGKNFLKNPSTQKLADCLGLNTNIDIEQLRDVVIVGAGPSGLAAAVYAASEGLDSLVIETDAPGGQAGSSSKIENYLGFPTGVSGQELAARAITQAQKFGAKMMIAHQVVALHCGRRPYQVILDNETSIGAKAIIIATGAQYNKPPIANLKGFEGQGVYYGATHIEAQLCGSDDVVVVGGGNSAGQAAVYLAQGRKVYMLVRGADLSAMMSRYLIQRITENPHIELHFHTEITGLTGNGSLEKVTWTNRTTGEVTTRDLRHVFVMAGASPRTEWLQGCVALDDKGFILTGRDIDPNTGVVPPSAWPLTRAPQMLETSLPGVFAVGDVRAGNVKRVASAVGEGAIAVHMVHRVLAEM